MTNVNGANSNKNVDFFTTGSTKRAANSTKSEAGHIWAGYMTPTVGGAKPPSEVSKASQNDKASKTYVIGNAKNPEEGITQKELSNVLDLNIEYSAIPKEKRTSEQKSFLEDYNNAFGNMKELNNLVKTYSSFV